MIYLITMWLSFCKSIGPIKRIIMLVDRNFLQIWHRLLNLSRLVPHCFDLLRYFLLRLRLYAIILNKIFRILWCIIICKTLYRFLRIFTSRLIWWVCLLRIIYCQKDRVYLSKSYLIRQWNNYFILPFVLDSSNVFSNW